MAEYLNKVSKFVVSSTMKDPGWERSTWGEAVQGRDERPRLKLVDNRCFRSGVVLTSHRTDG